MCITYICNSTLLFIGRIPNHWKETVLVLKKPSIWLTPPPPTQPCKNKQTKTKKIQQMVTFLFWLKTKQFISSHPPPWHFSSAEFLSPHLIHICPSVALVWLNVCFALCFATKANGLLPVIDTVLELCRVKPNAYLRAQARVSHN